MSHRLNDVAPRQEFVTCAGEKINNLYSLSKALSAMSDDVFSHHVNSSKNDFYRWVFDVVKDYTLARQLNRASSRAKMHRVVKQRIYDLEKTTENVVDVPENKSKYSSF